MGGQTYFYRGRRYNRRMLMNFEKMGSWKKTKLKAPTNKISKNQVQIAEMIERDYQTECAKYNDDGTPK